MGQQDLPDPDAKQRERDEKARQAKRADEIEQADFRWLMGQARGRRIVWRLLEHAGVFRLSFNTNAMQMAFAEGNRNYGHRVLEQIHALCPELYHPMVQENTKLDRDAAGDRKAK